jgi:ferrous iron transport protein A
VSDKTIKRIATFMRFARTAPEDSAPWLSEFRDHVNENSKQDPEEPADSLCDAVTSEEALMLDMTPVGREVTVVRVTGEKDIKRKLLDMGIVPGVRVRVERVAPMGDPIDVVVRGYHLSLRKAEAAMVIVKENG